MFFIRLYLKNINYSQVLNKPIVNTSMLFLVFIFIIFFHGCFLWQSEIDVKLNKWTFKIILHSTTSGILLKIPI